MSSRDGMNGPKAITEELQKGHLKLEYSSGTDVVHSARRVSQSLGVRVCPARSAL